MGLAGERPTLRDLDPATYGFEPSDAGRALRLQPATGSAVAGLLGNADVNADGETTLDELTDFLRAT